jgi:hypothetical protein
MRKLAFLLAAAALVLASPARTQAGLMLYLDDGVGNTATISDGGSGDSNPLAGAITFIGPLGVWSLNVTTALSKHTGLPPMIDLNSVNSSEGSGTLALAMFDTDFTGFAGPTTLTSRIGGTTVGSLTYLSGWDNGNVGGVYSGIVASFEVFGPGAFSGTFPKAVLLSDPFALSQAVFISHSGAGTTSFDAEHKVPEPGTMTLLGLGFLTLAFRRWRTGR